MNKTAGDTRQLAELWITASLKFKFSPQHHITLSLMLHAYYPSTWQVKTGRSETQDSLTTSWLHQVIEVSLGDITPCLKK